MNTISNPRTNSPPTPLVPHQTNPFQIIPGTPDSPSPRKGNKQKRIGSAYIRMLRRVRVCNQHLHVAPTVKNNTESQTSLREPCAKKLTPHMPIQAAPRQTTEPSLNSDSNCCTNLYFRAQANHRPEMGGVKRRVSPTRSANSVETLIMPVRSCAQCTAVRVPKYECCTSRCEGETRKTEVFIIYVLRFV
jgi:hypothetical protein